MPQQRTFTYDANLLMKDAGALVASAASQVGGVDKILNLGAGRVQGVVVVDVTAIDTVTGDEKYELEFQLSSSATFASDIVVAAVLKLGGAAATGGSAADAVGRRELHVTNEVVGVRRQYARLYNRLAGTTPSINHTAFLAKHGDA